MLEVRVEEKIIAIYFILFYLLIQMALLGNKQVWGLEKLKVDKYVY